jgi:hypothetical protein
LVFDEMSLLKATVQVLQTELSTLISKTQKRTIEEVMDGIDQDIRIAVKRMTR